ncbi:MAG: protein kinase [Oscillospiraceae bacterium]|jgi:serine/threonine protein kinase/tetratricopeptide (TPR) repeat protein|nr:protein kinase [Oscillospiraceae bacterium]
MSIERLSQVWSDWKVDSLIGEGSFGKVYKAVREEHGMTTYSAIKIVSIPQSDAEITALRSEGMSKEATTSYFQGAVNDFVNEIKLMESMKGTQNIVSVEDFKVLEKEDAIGWDIFIRMELLTSFSDYIGEKILTELEVIKIGEDILTALDLCSQKNIIHRDIKPENIFISSFGYFKLGDFGIARELEKTTGNMSQKGTFNYMAPEVAANRSYDATVDTYSLGIVLYKLLNNNRLPFVDPTSQTIQYQERKNAVDKRLAGEALPVPYGASSTLAQVILKACAPNPVDRYKSPTEFKKALEAVKAGEVVPYFIPTDDDSPLNETVAVRSAGRVVEDTQNYKSGNSMNPYHEQAKKPNKSIALVVAVLAVCAVGIVAFILLNQNVFSDGTRDVIKALENQNFDEAMSAFSNVDTDSAELERELQRRLEAIKVEFLNGEIEYSVAKMELQTIERFRIRSLSTQINEVSQFLDEMNDSRVAFEYAESLFESGDYLRAMEQYALVLMDDTNYTAAQEGLSASVEGYKVSALKEAETLADANNYAAAIRVLDNALEIVGNDVDLTRQRNLYAGEQITNSIDEAKSMANSGNYTGAVNSLRTLQTQHPDNNDVSRALSDIEASHIQDILSQSSNYLSNNNFDSARRVLNDGTRLYSSNTDISNAMTTLQTSEKNDLMGRANVLASEGNHDGAISLLRNSSYSNSSEMLTLINDINNMRPVILGVDIVPYQSERILLFTETVPGSMMGAPYITGLRANTNRWNRTASAYFNLGENYTFMSGLYGPIGDSPGGDNVNLTIWGDGKMLATYEIAITDPVKVFNVNVSGISQLFFEFNHIENNNNDTWFGVANIVLSTDNRVSARFNDPIGLYTDNAVLGRDISAYRIPGSMRQLSRAEPITVMGIEYDNGVVINSNSDSGNIYYNLNNQYTRLTGTYGPLDGISSDATGTINIFGDGRLIESFNVRAGDVAKTFSVDVTGVTQLRVYITTNRTWNRTSRFCVVEMRATK